MGTSGTLPRYDGGVPRLAPISKSSDEHENLDTLQTGPKMPALTSISMLIKQSEVSVKIVNLHANTSALEYGSCLGCVHSSYLLITVIYC